MPKLLIIYAHPGHAGHHGYFLQQVREALQSRQHNDYELLDLCAIGYQPVLGSDELGASGRHEADSISRSFQDKVKAADLLLFIYPTWWQNMPAVLKGFVDKVFTRGFAFNYDKHIPIGLLKGKRAAIFSASGAPRVYTRFFKFNQHLGVLAKDVLKFSGIKSKGFSIGSARHLNDKKRAELRRMAEKAVRYLLK